MANQSSKNTDTCKHEKVIENIASLCVYTGCPPIICEDCGQNVLEFAKRYKFDQAVKNWTHSVDSDDA